MGSVEARAVQHSLAKGASRSGSVGGAGHSHGGCISQQHRVPGLIRRNQHALLALSRRTQTPVLPFLLRACSFRLVNDAAHVDVGAWLGRSATSSGPCSPSFGIAPSPVANSQPKRHHQPDDRRPGRRIESTHLLQRMGPNGVAAVASPANEVRRTMLGRSAKLSMRIGRTGPCLAPRLYGSLAPSMSCALLPVASTLTALASLGTDGA